MTVGVISDSDNQYGGGIAASVSTGDLPNNVVTLFDDPDGGGTDEGRAMLEDVYKIAPGVQLKFASGIGPTADLGDIGFADAIVALANAGSKVIVDDESIPDEPMFQDGIVAQAVNTVVNTQGVSYFGSAGNAADSGYLSTFRGVNATVGSLGAGRYMNFDPTGATTTTQLGINVYTPGTGLLMQYDQPFYTTNGVTSQVNIYVLNAAGTVVASSTSNNIAMQEPIQLTDGLPVGLYSVVIQVALRPGPGTRRVHRDQRRRVLHRYQVRLGRRDLLSEHLRAPRGGQQHRRRGRPLLRGPALSEPGYDRQRAL